MVHRISVVGLRGIPNVMGGIEAHCERLYPRMQRLRNDLEFTVLARAPYVDKAITEYEGVRIRSIWSPKNKYLETIIHTFLAIFVARFASANILHMHAIGPCLLAPLAWALNLRIVATHHGHDYERLKWGAIAKRALRLAETLMVRYAHQVICVSSASAKMLRQKHPRFADRISHIPNAVEAVAPASVDTAILEELALGDEPFILAVGRLVPEKGFHDLVDAFERARPATRLVIVGAADHDDAYSGALMRRASERIVFAGRRTRPDLARLYERASLFVLPSYHEGHPVVALEAIAAGCPVLLSDIDANREIGLRAQHYFAVGDTAGLAALLANEDLTSFKVQGSDAVSASAIDEMVTRTLAVFETVITEKAR